MKITFLGTGPSGRIPRPNCKWYVCKEARKPGSKSARLQTSTFFEIEKHNILIDATDDFTKQRKLIKNKKIDYVFLTHGHFDAAGGLPQLSKDVKENHASTTIYAEKQVLKTAVKEISEFNLSFHYIVPEKQIDFSAQGGPASGWKVTPFRVEHSFNPKFPTLGYIFQIGKKRVIYASDFKIIPPESKKLIKNADLAILDCAAYNRPIPTHQSLPEVLKFIKELNFKKVYLTQVGIAWPHYELAQKIVSKQSKNIFLAYDGFKIKI